MFEIRTISRGQRLLPRGVRNEISAEGEHGKGIDHALGEIARCKKLRVVPLLEELDGDPRQRTGAKLIPELTHLQAIERGLKVMDTTALSLCMDNKLPIHVFELAPGNVARVAAGERVGTIISTPEGDTP